jgi:uncharacterized protein YlxP (DUF503 family)
MVQILSIRLLRQMENLYSKTHKYRVDFLPENYHKTLTCWDCGETKNRRLFPYRKQYKDNKEKRCKLCNYENSIKRRKERTLKQFIHNVVKTCEVSSTRRIKRGRVDCVFNITDQDVIDCLEKQIYKCIYTGKQLIHNGNMYDNISIDRMDSSKGYTKDNIQITTFWANRAKIDLEETRFLDFIKHTSEYDRQQTPVIRKIHKDTISQIKQKLKVCRASAKKRLKIGRNKSGICTITYEDVWKVTQDQGFRCYYTGLPIDFSQKERYLQPSIDRIDSSKGYTKDNIQITTFWANQSKADLDDTTFLKYVKDVYNYRILSN